MSMDTALDLGLILLVYQVDSTAVMFRIEALKLYSTFDGKVSTY